MTRLRARGEDIRRFILEQVDAHPTDISKLTAERFRITRQAVNKHLQKLVSEHALTESGTTRTKIYKLAPISEWTKTYKINSELAEDLVWINDIRKTLSQMPDNVIHIWHYGFTEMFNNAIDHSAGTKIIVHIRKTATTTEILISDNGIGIFKKIKDALNLLDERHALFELLKGKLSTDPKRHSGEGIFFTSRMFDTYDILSGEVYFSHEFGKTEDWISEILERKEFSEGTCVWMKLQNHTARNMKKIFDQYTSSEDYGFDKTVVPVKLAQYENDQLISRSQAKRLLARVELFKTVILDFKDVNYIGQAFADEIFRVFSSQHPGIEFKAVNINQDIKNMIARVKK